MIEYSLNAYAHMEVEIMTSKERKDLLVTAITSIMSSLDSAPTSEVEWAAIRYDEYAELKAKLEQRLGSLE